ncbi:hypothetical protein RCL1_006684 [Eukaryota sp. TZLM3-RCL]
MPACHDKLTDLIACHHVISTSSYIFSSTMTYIGSRYFRFVNACKYLIIVAWILAAVSSVYFTNLYMNSTRLSFDPPEGSQAHYANMLLKESFPDDFKSIAFLIFVDAGMASDDVPNYKGVAEFYNSINFTIYDTFPSLIVRNLNYWDLIEDHESIAEALVSSNGSAMMSLYQASGGDLEQLFPIVDHLRLFIDAHPLSSSLFIDVVSEAATFKDVRTSTIEDISRIDSIVLPLALLVLGIFLRSITGMIIPVISVIFSLSCSFALSYPLAKHVYAFASFTPSVQTTCIIAMSIDYSLFFLTRYKEERGKKRSPANSVDVTLKYSGEIILVSGSILATTFATLMFFPLEILKTIGLGTALSLIVTMLCTLTLTPSLLLVFPKAFGGKIDKTPEESSINQGKKLKEIDENLWFKISQFVTSPFGAIFVVIVVIAVVVPVAYNMKDFDWTIDNSQFIPANCRSQQSLELFSTAFPRGTLIPFNVVFVTRDRTPQIWTEEYFDVCGKFALDLNATLGSDLGEVVSLCFVYGTVLDFAKAKQMYFWNDDFKYLVHQLMTLNKEAALFTIRVEFDPLGDESIAFIDKLRHVIDSTTASFPQFEIAVASFAVDQLDSTRSILDQFPTVVLFTMIIIITLFVFVFKSFIAPLRLMFSIVLSISFIFGLGIVIYQKGTLLGDFLSPFSPTFKIIWVLPVMSFSILCGLSIDYDTFLSLRVKEYRLKGFTNRGAIIKGSVATSRVITAAGMIMALSFSGLMLSTSSLLNQFGFILSFSVLFDTFIVRSLLVPALTSLCGSLTYFPRWFSRVPREIYDEYSVEDDDEESSLLS